MWTCFFLKCNLFRFLFLFLIVVYRVFFVFCLYYRFCSWNLRQYVCRLLFPFFFLIKITMGSLDRVFFCSVYSINMCVHHLKFRDTTRYVGKWNEDKPQQHGAVLANEICCLYITQFIKLYSTPKWWVFRSHWAKITDIIQILCVSVCMSIFIVCFMHNSDDISNPSPTLEGSGEKNTWKKKHFMTSTEHEWSMLYYFFLILFF